MKDDNDKKNKDMGCEPNSPASQSQDIEIDLMALFMKVWNRKIWILKVCGIALLAGLVVAYSIPKEYETTVTLAPESTTGNVNSSGGLGALASMAGINIGNSASGVDALGPSFYSDIVASTPFLVELFPMEVKDDDKELDKTLYEYIRDDQSYPWWRYLMSPGMALGAVRSLFSSKDDAAEMRQEMDIDPQRLTPEQSGVAGAISSKIKVENDNGMTSITVSMQDPMVSAQVADSVMSKIQQYITDYRTNKARKDLEFTEKMYDEAEANYRTKQDEYAHFVDANQNIILQSFRTEQERLQNERDLAYNVYNTVAQQLQTAKMKVQETKPVFAVIQSAVVPLSASKPNKMLIVVAFIFLALVGSTGWVLFGKDIYTDVRQYMKSSSAAAE